MLQFCNSTVVLDHAGQELERAFPFVVQYNQVRCRFADLHNSDKTSTLIFMLHQV